MKRFFTMKKAASRENLFAFAFLFVYGFLILVSDPEWLMWAGPVTLGVFPVEAPHVLPAFDSLETLRSASYSVLPGLLALIVLLRIGAKRRCARNAEAPGEEKPEAAREAPEHRKAA
jgi:hypothetical protein